MTESLRWRKLGLVIKPETDRWWWKSHAMTPTPEDLGDGWVKVYFSGRNADNQSHIGWAIIDLAEPTTVQDISPEPVLAPGPLGRFDDNGVTPSCVVNVGDEKRLYYIGWNPGSTVRVNLYGGLAISTDGGATFRRWSNAPILERVHIDPYLNTAPWAVRSDEGWNLYYVSGTEWVHKDLPRYNIKMATSKDGLTWNRDGHVCIDYQNGDENALARPYVVRDDDLWRMWFAHKGPTYRMGYAESDDGRTWTRRDDLAGINLSDTGFDSEMIEYGAVVRHAGRSFMFYNGNNYGYDGIGLAVHE